MLINVKDRIILLHNPKTGGRFRGNVCGNKYFHSPSSIELKKPVRNVSHITYDQTREAMPETFDMYKIFTVVRNPYDRFVSAVNFCFDSVFEECGWEKSVDNALSLVESNEVGVLFSMDKPWFTPQSLYMGDKVEILKYENTDDWERLCRMLKFDFREVKIKPHYVLSGEQKERIKAIYGGYDKQIFEIYKEE